VDADRPGAEGLPGGFGLGNLDDYELGEMLDKAWGADVFRILSEKGPLGLLNGPLDSVYVNKCHLCSEVFGRLLA